MPPLVKNKYIREKRIQHEDEKEGGEAERFLINNNLIPGYCKGPSFKGSHFSLEWGGFLCGSALIDLILGEEGKGSQHMHEWICWGALFNM